jgi:hypothetical protein
MEMVKMDVQLTHLVKDKLGRPYWDLIDKLQHTHLFRSFPYLTLLLAEGMFS